MGLLLAAALVAVGCGKKSPPLPPALPMPPGVTDLGKALQGGTLTLSWSQPKGSGIDLSHVEGFYVYRSLVKLPAPDCQGCPLTFTKAAEVPFDGGPMSYYETLRKGYRYTYKVTPYSPGGRPGADSNLVTLDY
jgi:hypothetical protein